MEGDDNQRPTNRHHPKSHVSSRDYSRWKLKLRENCYKRVRDDRTRLLWKFRLPKATDGGVNSQDFIKSSFQDIVLDEMRKIKFSSSDDGFGTPSSPTANDDEIWDCSSHPSVYEGDYEEMFLEMQRIFYEDLRMEETRKGTRSWQDEEDDFLAHAVYEHMQLNDKQIRQEVWCPICKQGQLKEIRHLITCTLCGLKLSRGDEVNLELLRSRLADAHLDHLDRGCRLQPEFSIETVFGLTALWIRCQGCTIFELVI